MKKIIMWKRWLVLMLAFGLLAAACGDSDDTEIADPSPPTTDDEGDSAEPTDPGGSDDPGDPGDPDDPPEPVAEGALAGACPSPLVIQTDWFPESEHGALYHLIGEGYEVDTGNKVVRGPLVLDGTDLGIDLEVRTGGPAIGFAPVSSYMYTDDSIHLGYASTDSQILQWESAPLVSVVAPLEKNPQMVMWDPETYPNVNGIADLGDEGVTVNVFAGGVFPEVFVAQGIWDADQVDPSYDGSPARFVAAGGSIAQQGFASAEVYTYEHTFEEWGKPVAFQLLHDAGFQIYSQTIGVRPRDLDELRPCLELLVPVIQQAVVSYEASPDAGNAVIVDAVDQYADFWVYEPDLAEYSVQAQREFGLIGNGPDSTVGNLQVDRVQRVLDSILATDLAADVPGDLTAEDLFSNEFIDPDIGFPVEPLAEGALAAACPSPLVIQTDWFPESEHGALYHLIGEGYEVDTGNKVVRGPLVLDGTDLGIDLEVRTGGPAIGFAPVSSYMYTDDSIHLGYASTDSQILQWESAPLVSVVAPLEKNPQMVMWDPETYPNVSSIADLGDEGVTVNVFAGGVFPEVFVAQGIWDADQVDPSYDGSPARFVAAGGSIAQQGFASAEVYTYEHTFEEWGKPVAFQLLHDAGFQIYSQTIGVRPRDIDTLRPCLELLVPVIQQAVVSYDASPDAGNAVIVDAVDQYDDFWVYEPDLAQYSVQAQREFGLIGNGPDSTVGNFETERIQRVLDSILVTDLAADVPADLAVEDLFTNEFINPDIGF